MKRLWTKKVPIEDIDASGRLRPISEEHVEVFAATMAEHGVNPAIDIALYDGKVRLMAGGHRLEAARRLGWTDVLATGYEPATDRPDLECRLHEVDENLIRYELNPLDRAAFLAERKRIYEELHPEVKKGAQGGRGGKTNENEIFSFSKSAAQKTGFSPRLIERAVRIHGSLSPDILTLIRGSTLAGKEGELYRLAGLDRATQRAVVNNILSGKSSNVETAARKIRGEAEPNADEIGFQRLISAWAKATPAARKQFLGFIQEAK